MIARILLAATCAIASCSFAWASPPAQAEPPPAAFAAPDRYQLVNDYVGVLTVEQSVALTAKLQSLERDNGTQVVFLSVPSIGDDSLYDYAVRVAERWDIGNNGQGNGVLFLVTQAQGVQILTGDGIGGALPDAKVGRIIRNSLAPAFERGEFAEGVLATVDELVKAARGEDTAPTSLDYSHLDGGYFSPALGLLDRLVATGAWRRWLAGVLTILLITYAAALGWRRFRRIKASA